MTMKPPSVSLVFPAWNEEEYVERAVARALVVLARITTDYEIVIVDDASTDRTWEILQALARRHPQLRVVRHGVNQKLGGSLRTLFAMASKDVVVYSDIDLPFDLNEVERAIRLMQYLEADLITGFRFDRTSEGLRRIAYSFGYNLLIRVLFGVRVKDINFSFKVIHRRVLDAIELKSCGSLIDAELVVKTMRRGFRVAQIGVDYFPRSRGISTLSSPAVIGKILRELLALYSEMRRPGPMVRPIRRAGLGGVPLETPEGQPALGATTPASAPNADAVASREAIEEGVLQAATMASSPFFG
jgi:glycosyltransferase involved in cell wall biosynthesis